MTIPKDPTMSSFLPSPRFRRAFLSSVVLSVLALGGARVYGDPPPEPLDRYPTGRVTIKGHHPDRVFKVWVAGNDARREQGLMYVKSLPADQGMLFVFEQAEILTFWMKNTFIPLDLLYIGTDGRVVRIAENAVPFSLAAIPSGKPANEVLEIAGGLSRSLQLVEGDLVVFAADKH
jgi:hypothetical protein